MRFLGRAQTAQRKYVYLWTIGTYISNECRISNMYYHHAVPHFLGAQNKVLKG